MKYSLLHWIVLDQYRYGFPSSNAQTGDTQAFLMSFHRMHEGYQDSCATASDGVT